MNTVAHRINASAAGGVFAAAAPISRVIRRPNVALCLALAAVLLLSVPTWSPRMTPRYYVSGQEGPVPPTLQYEMDRCFDDGQLPCRWAPDVGQGYGVPVFNYYGPLPYYVGEFIHLGGVGYFRTIDVLYVISFVLAGLFMFLLAREFWGILGGLVSAVFYIYAPWQASLAYVQGSLAHHWALAFFPAILWAAYKVIQEGKPAYVLLLALSMTALLLSHNLLVMMFLPVAMVWVLTLLVATKNWQRAIHLAIAGVAAFSLAAFFTLPVLLERDLAHLERATSGYYDYAGHFPRLKQLFLSRFWGYGPSVPGDADLMSFQIGWLHWALTVVVILIAPILWRRSRAGFWAAIVCIVFFWGSVFLMHPRSDFLWRTFSLLRWQLFPFRFLGVAILTSSFLAGAVLLPLKRRRLLNVALSIALIGAVIGLNREFFRAGDREYGEFSGPVWAIGPRTDVWTVTQPEYATAVPSDPAPTKVQVISGDADITQIQQGSDSLVFAANSREGARLQASVTDFPSWRVTVDGRTVSHDHANPFAAISFDLPAGSHGVELRLKDTAIRKLANYWSLAAWAVFIISAGGLTARAGWSAFAKARSRTGSSSDLPAGG